MHLTNKDTCKRVDEESKKNLGINILFFWKQWSFSVLNFSTYIHFILFCLYIKFMLSFVIRLPWVEA